MNDTEYNIYKHLNDKYHVILHSILDIKIKNKYI